MRRYSEAVRELYEVTGPCHGGPVPCPPNLTTALRRGVPYVPDGPLRATAWICVPRRLRSAHCSQPNEFGHCSPPLESLNSPADGAHEANLR